MSDNDFSSTSKEEHDPSALEKGPELPEGYTAEHADNEGADGAPLALRRTQSRTSQEGDLIARVLSQSSMSSRLSRRDAKTPLPKMGGGKPYPPDLPQDREQYKVDFDGPDDPIFPHNWKLTKKAVTCVVLGYTTMVTAWASSSFSAAIPYISANYGIGSVTATLGMTLYVLGFATGPVVWAPLSELYGRKMPILVSMLGLTCFSFGTAVAKDVQTIMLTRFFGGAVGSAPLAVVAAAFSDLFGNETRGLALCVFSATVFVGPMLAPIVSGFIADSYLGWRWTEYITGIMAGFALFLDVVFYTESYHPIILVSKAQELRRRTGNWGIFASQESVELDLHGIVVNNLARPILMLFREPILLIITIYTAFVYGILYLLLEAYPIVFMEGYKMTGGVAMLPYLAIAIGEVIGGLVMGLFLEPIYLKHLKQNNGKPVPEMRLLGAMLGAMAFPIGIFWFTWTGQYHEQVHWMAPTAAGVFIGFGLLSIFLGSINYIVDTYLVFAASAMAANTFLRSACGAVFPLFAPAMFHNLGTNWAGTLIGCIAILLMPMPFLFFKYGKKIRQKSKYAFDL